MRILRQKLAKNQTQLELDIGRPYELDRNAHLGGKSFYFFDFDDNVAYLSTPIVIFHKQTGEEKTISSGEFARENKNIGTDGKFADYFLNFDDFKGSFRHFRDKNFSLIDKIIRKKQLFLKDIESALETKDYGWKAPSWNCFYHATFNRRPVSIITARGHNQETIMDGINLMVRDGHLPHTPNYLSIYPVSNPDVRLELGDKKLVQSVPELKRAAIRESVEKAIQVYGHSPYHRFGMSDDDPKNVELITEEMKELKRKYSDMSFFVIYTKQNTFEKKEIIIPRKRRTPSSEPKPEQLGLF
ncbi:MAG: hypothetical protein COW01_02120 [Bdellovibrionales bacterium CG12_big_fil_rev_8_21_14_0_65_38_15]|nr:MAG: hypothetical protein COW79_02355 [Bdellovibrionales bacterium CG22_combo_CG10-13_8_21_14_all_38_13]PIQ57102.1 MAG: hypothetical protein COW01_02120 [Bdellovibrionales bacterium CG12_big_fil_rev_8_21_14_0_65_38_15]PIR30132.1 MAG: hypothetical protein COV38_07515 [Bdellovibrionales bacterium CG11_big_fil_rev_8_21_14_0_20_38_13]